MPTPSDRGEICRTAGSPTARVAWWRAAAGGVRVVAGGGVAAAPPDSSLSSASSSPGGGSGAGDRVREGGADSEAEGFAETDGDALLDAAADAESVGVRPEESVAFELPLPGDRPGLGRPSPACRPARLSDALGLAATVGPGTSGSAAYAQGVASSRSDATVVAHRVRSPGVTG